MLEMRKRTDILLSAAELDIGASRRITCPGCGHTTCSITREQQGVLYHCYRASCGQSGFIPTAGALVPAERPTERPMEPYTGSTYPLGPDSERFFLDRYELPIQVAKAHIFEGNDGRYVLPVRNSRGQITGYVLRTPWKDAPRQTYYSGPKARVYWHGGTARQALYARQQTRAKEAQGRILLVEDQLSAIKASVTGVVDWAVAMLGTGGSKALHSLGGADEIREIAMLKPREVIVAYDKDAAALGFDWARKWGLAFPKVRVAMLEQDIKDTPLSDIADALGIVE